MTMSRRTFLRASAAGAMTLYTTNALGLPEAVAEGIPGGSLPATQIPQFRNRLVVPQIAPCWNRTWTNYGATDYYEMSLRQFRQQMLPTGMPQTTVWGYGPSYDDGRGFHAPGLTILARAGGAVRIKWTNDLVDANGNYLPHLFAVDPTLHWANVPQEPAGGMRMTDMKPDYTGRRYVRPENYTDPTTQYTSYTGPVPIVTHLHGAVGVKDHSDGYSEAWYLPNARNIPAGHARHGRWWDFLAAKARRETGVVWSDGQQVATYPNGNRVSTLWFHDHAMGLTRLNVYSGATNFYLVRGTNDDVLDSRTGRTAIAPWLNERDEYLKSSPNPGHDIPLAIQDRSFNADGSLFYPDSRAFFDNYQGPYYPEAPGIAPNWVPEFFGNTLIVNGQTWPFHRVEQRRYRFRVLNGCGSRTLYLDFRGIPGVEVWQTGNDGGMLDRAVNVSALPGWKANRVMLAPAERVELLVDFTRVPTGRHILRNVGPDAFFPGGRPAENGETPRVKLYPFAERDVVFPPADPATTGRVMAFDVVPPTSVDTTTPGRYLQMRAVPKLPAPVRTRRLSTTMSFHQVGTDPAPYASHTMLGVLSGTPGGQMKITGTMWGDPVTENPAVGDVEDWEIYNLVQDAPVPHPIHVHETTFEVIERRMVHYDWETGQMTMGPQVPLEPGETGRKDTVFVYPGEMIRIRMKFTTAGQYMWHCHLLEHEDNEMMRPFRVGPWQDGQPADMDHHGTHEM
ncbi:multicopper oxidase family protein [Luteococcus sp. Sow4_B9]|uniref:multicopper oxidase family protein n=1 Tax=Luteococcus sp. Sow4_B9 TaxID=3438792 RepID=UPI003F9EAF62